MPRLRLGQKHFCEYLNGSGVFEHSYINTEMKDEKLMNRVQLPAVSWFIELAIIFCTKFFIFSFLFFDFPPISQLFAEMMANTSITVK